MADEVSAISQQETAVSEREKPASEPEKMFSQQDLDEIIQKKLEKERRKLPPKEELEAFSKWKESQQTEQERQRALVSERDGLKKQVEEHASELEQMRRENLLLRRGIEADDVDYYAFKIGKMVTDVLPFERAAEQFFKDKENSEKLMPRKNGVTVSFSTAQGGGISENVNQTMNSLIRGAIR